MTLVKRHYGIRRMHVKEHAEVGLQAGRQPTNVTLTHYHLLTNAIKSENLPDSNAGD